MWGRGMGREAGRRQEPITLRGTSQSVQKTLDRVELQQFSEGAVLFARLVLESNQNGLNEPGGPIRAHCNASK